MARIIRLPYKFNPRPYQIDTIKAIMVDGYRNFIDIEHRRAGKDFKWINIIIALSQRRVGTYLHTFPKYTTARTAIWDGIDDNGQRFLDLFPKKLIADVNQTKTSIKFKNGSIYRLGGADKYDSWMGTNPIFVLYSEYAIQDPRASDFFAPILVNNNGIQAYIYTPRGKNHGYTLYDKNKNNPNWYTQYLTVNDTKNFDGSAVISADKIQLERERGVPEEIIQQEYYCSFDSSLVGAYFAKEMSMAREQGRIGNILISPDWPVSTYWDLGQNDKTCIWFIQKHPKRDEFYVIDYYENYNQPRSHYINVVYDKRNKWGYNYLKHYAPHDVKKRETSNIQIIEKYRRDGLPMEPVRCIRNKRDAIDMAKAVIHKCYFHETNCERGLAALNSYHAKYDSNKDIYLGPEHDWASDGADAFMQFAQTNQEQVTHNGRIIYNAVNSGSLF